MKVVELFVCEGRWSGACDPESADASDGGGSMVIASVCLMGQMQSWSGMA